MAEGLMSISIAVPTLSASCPICTNNFDEASETVALVCGHVFHRHCSAEWLKQSLTCPQCRKKLRNEQRDQMKIFLSFGDQESSSGGSIGNGEEVPGLAELRAKLAALTKEQELAKSQIRRSKRRDMQMRQDISQKQRQLDEFSSKLRSCQETLADQEAENCQLMQLMAQEHEQLTEEARQLRRQLDEERLERKRLDETLCEHEADWSRQLRVQSSNLRAENAELLNQLEESQQEVMRLMEKLEAEKWTSIQLRDQLLSLEAESLQLSKRLHNCQAATSNLLLFQSTGRRQNGDKINDKDDFMQFVSLPALSAIASDEIPSEDNWTTIKLI